MATTAQSIFGTSAFNPKPFQGPMAAGQNTELFRRSNTTQANPLYQPISNTAETLSRGYSGRILGTNKDINIGGSRGDSGGGSSRGGSSFTENNVNYRNQADFDRANPGYNDGGYEDVQRADQERARAELQGLNTQYDETRGQLQEQLPFLESKRQRGLSDLQSAVDAAGNSVQDARLSAQQTGEQNIQQAGDTARNTQRSVRNTLRSLGILSSSAAGELLSKPLNEFDKVRANIVQGVTQRVGELDTFLTQKVNENANLVANLEDQYSQLIGGIQRDLRFNERDRADAVRNANASLSSRLAEVKQAQMGYENQIASEKRNIALQLAQMGSYQAPAQSLSGITGTANIDTGSATNNTTQASMFGFDPNKKLSDTSQY